MDAALSEELRQYARRALGFNLAGITAALPLEGGVRLARWLAAGAHGEMAYMARTAAVRVDPQRFLPGARSVVVVALSYHDGLALPSQHLASTVQIARYARRRDYHHVLRRRLVTLGRFLAARRPGCRWRVAVDTAPLLERELAQRAGLGWIGKNTCLINRRLGSNLFLGELVTDVELAPDPPGRNHCGRCTACLDACPTAAFPHPGFLDARRCISYLTLEHRSAFQPHQAAAVGRHLAGCDICQDVCPWNRRAPASCDSALATRPHLVHPTVAALALLDEPGWQQFSAGTPLRRLDFDRFSRNLAAIGEHGEGVLPRPLAEEARRPPPSRFFPTKLDTGEHKDYNNALKGAAELPREEWENREA